MVVSLHLRSSLFSSLLCLFLILADLFAGLARKPQKVEANYFEVELQGSDTARTWVKTKEIQVVAFKIC